MNTNANQTKRTYKKQPLVLKKFLTSEQKKILMKLTKSIPKKNQKISEKASKLEAKEDKKKAKEDEKQAIKDAKQAAKDEKQAAKDAEKQAAKDEKQAAKDEKQAAKDAEKQRIKDAKQAAKDEKKALKDLEKKRLKVLKKAEKSRKQEEAKKVPAGNIMSVINTDQNTTQPTLVEEAKNLSAELEAEPFITAEDLVSQAQIEVEPKKKVVKKRGRPRKSDLEITTTVEA